MRQRKDIDIYDHKTFSNEMIRLVDQYNCTITVKENYKISKLCDDYTIVTWFRCASPYEIILSIVEFLVGKGNLKYDRLYKIKKDDPVLNPKYEVGIPNGNKFEYAWFDANAEWALETLVVIAEMYNEMKYNTSEWPIVIHTLTDNENDKQSIIHPGNNRWFVSQFDGLGDITADLIEIDYTKKDVSNIFNYFDKLPYGVRISEYFDKNIDRKIEMYSPSDLSNVYTIHPKDTVTILLKNNQLIYNKVPLYTFDHDHKTIRVEKLSREDIAKITNPAPSWIHRETKMKDHQEKIKNGELKTTYHPVKDHED